MEAGMKLNLGCGMDIRHGYFNFDNGSSNPLVDGVEHLDLNWEIWPIAGNSADEILMWHVLEHLPKTETVMENVHRILKPDGIFWGQVPYGPSHDGRTNWQHCKYFVARSFEGLARDFNFELIEAKNICHSVTWRHRLPNLVPFKETLALAGWSEAFDAVNFKLRKK
jgi:ubiquinone/menaquinone biosynthesis C-methylase UbiE